MSLKNCWRSLLVSMVLIGASSSFAQVSDEQDSTMFDTESQHDELAGGHIGQDPIRPFPGGPGSGYGMDCRRYNNNPRLCEQVQGCQFSRIYNECIPESGPVNPYPGQYCSQYSQDYQSCVSAGCLFDGRTGACYDDNGGPVQPISCSRYNYNEFQCESNGCYYDRRTSMCSRQGGGPGPGPGYQNWTCTAADSAWEEHSRGHDGWGRSRFEAERDALYSCQQFHGRCVIRSCRNQ